MKNLPALILAGLLAAAPLAASAGPDHQHGTHDMRGASHHGVGVIKRVNADGVSLTHEPIASLKWPAMTMDLKVADRALLDQVKAGQKVEFDLASGPGGSYVIKAFRPAK